MLVAILAGDKEAPHGPEKSGLAGSRSRGAPLCLAAAPSWGDHGGNCPIHAVFGRWRRNAGAITPARNCRRCDPRSAELVWSKRCSSTTTHYGPGGRPRTEHDRRRERSIRDLVVAVDGLAVDKLSQWGVLTFIVDRAMGSTARLSMLRA